MNYEKPPRSNITGKSGSAIDKGLLGGLAVNETDHFLGNTDAKIILLLYEDYECENCGKSFRELRALREYFKQEICIVFRHFPFIQMHPSALLAALVVESCALQHKFIQAHDLIFECQEFLEYGLGGILRLLQKDYFVSIEQLNDDLEREDLKRKINDDIESGKRCGIKNTPAIFINDCKYEKTVKFDQITNVIRKMISKDNFYFKNKADRTLQQKYLLGNYA